MGSWFRRPSHTLLSLSQGHTLTVRTFLTHGERSAMRDRQYEYKDGILQLKPGQLQAAMAAAYLVDWSLTDDSGQRVAIFQQPAEVVERILQSLPDYHFDEIFQAIEAHEQQQVAARTQEKKVDADPISPLPSDAAGVLIGSGT